MCWVINELVCVHVCVGLVRRGVCVGSLTTATPCLNLIHRQEVMTSTLQHAVFMSLCVCVCVCVCVCEDAQECEFVGKYVIMYMIMPAYVCVCQCVCLCLCLFVRVVIPKCV